MLSAVIPPNVYLLLTVPLIVQVLSAIHYFITKYNAYAITIFNHYYFFIFEFYSSLQGSLWSIDGPSRSVKARLSSPVLSAKYGANFGIQGQPYRSPENTFIIVPNKNLNMLHILQPTSTTTNIVELALNKPGNIEFWPKDSSITFQLDKNASNYLMVIPVSTGVAFLDMSYVVKAFAQGLTTISNSSIIIVPVSTGGTSRTIVRGNNYIMTPVYSPSGSAINVAVIDIKLKKIVHNIPIASALKWLWVPIQSNELASQVTKLQSQLATFTSGTSSSHSHDVDKTDVQEMALQALIIGSIGLIFAFVAFIYSCMLGIQANKRTDGHKLMSDHI